MRLKKWKDNTPILIGEIKHNGDCPVIDVWCPYCNQQHRHGWPHGSSKGAFPRVAHCINKNSPYYMKDILIQNQETISKSKLRDESRCTKLNYSDLKYVDDRGFRGYSNNLDYLHTL